MDEFIEYLSTQIEAGRKETARLEAQGRQDDANFAKVRTNIYKVCRTVTNALKDRPGAGAEAVRAQLERFEASWNDALEKARTHGDAKGVVVEETKLQALEDAIRHFSEVEK